MAEGPVIQAANVRALKNEINLDKIFKACLLYTSSEKYKSPIVEGLPEFSGGAVGCFSYDLVRLSEKDVYKRQLLYRVL